MQTLPHRYVVLADGGVDGEIVLESDSLPGLSLAPPKQFDGPGDHWSPETLLVGATAACFVLTFRAVARASRLPWAAMRCSASGALERAGTGVQFTRIDLNARIEIEAGTDPQQARRALEKAERGCLISNSLKAEVHLNIEIAIVDAIAHAEQIPSDSLA
jgi:peroxiredoxin-like protein